MDMTIGGMLGIDNYDLACIHTKKGGKKTIGNTYPLVDQALFIYCNPSGPHAVGKGNTPFSSDYRRSASTYTFVCILCSYEWKRTT